MDGLDVFAGVEQEMENWIMQGRAITAEGASRAPLAGTALGRVRDSMSAIHLLPKLKAGPLDINPAIRLVTTEGLLIRMSHSEYVALLLLVCARGAIVGRDEISVCALRHPRSHAEDRCADQLVFTLRRKLPAGPYGRDLIQGARGQGYYFAAEVEALN